jgi:hypothetical protein
MSRVNEEWEPSQWLSSCSLVVRSVALVPPDPRGLRDKQDSKYDVIESAYVKRLFERGTRS